MKTNETDKHLSGKKALITGAGRGMGKAIALAYARHGADLIVTDLHTQAVEEVAAEARGLGVRAKSMAWDVADIRGIPARFDEAIDHYDGLDVVVNNAGVLYLPDSDPIDEWDFVLGINLKAVYFICKHAIQCFQEKGGGTIVNIASDAGLRPAPDPYSISKTGVVGLTRGLGKRHARENIRINAVAPGPVATDMMGCADGQPKEAPNLPMGRFSLATEIADVAVLLASDASARLHGQIIVVNSGSS